MFHQVEGNLTVGLLRLSWMPFAWFSLAGGAAAGDDVELDGAAITRTLEERCVIGNQDGLVWEQEFQRSGVTIYRARGERPSEGRWRVKSDRFCSQWPPSRAWTCYVILADGNDITFVPDDGGDSWRAALKPVQ